MLDLCTLGTGGALPLPDRGLSSLYARVNGHGLLIDCGEGTQTAIRRVGWGFRAIEGMLITHYHGDHCGGLPGFLLSMSKAERTEPFHIYGPIGLRRIVEGLCVIAPHLDFPLVLHELPGDETPFSLIGLTITPFRLDHGMPCLGYRLMLPRQAAFDPQKAQALSVPVTCWHALQGGEAVTIGTRLIQPCEVLGDPRPGITLVYATDTRPVPSIARIGRHADLMILEGMYGGEDKRPQALKNHHMLFREAAALARDAEASALLLTHFSNCIEDPAAYLPNAQEIFPNTNTAEDGLCLTLRYPTPAKTLSKGYRG